MDCNFELKGVWFLPNNSKRVNGILTYHEIDGIDLELFGHLPGDGTAIILGLTTDSKLITLCHSYRSRIGGQKFVRGQEAGQPTETWRVNFLLEGHHFLSPNELMFENAVCKFHDFDKWVGISGFSRNDQEINEWKRHEVNIRFKVPRSIEFSITNTLSGMFNFTAQRTDVKIYQDEIRVSQNVELHLNSTSALNIEDFLTEIYTFQNLVTLGLFEATYPTKITLKSSKVVKEFDDGEKVRKVKKGISLSFIMRRSKKSRRDISRFDMFFFYQQIEGQFQEIIKRWFQNRITLDPVFKILFEQFYNGDSFDENTFLNLAQAAETFHARVHSRTKIPKTDYRKRTQEIIALVPPLYHNWLKEQFKFGNHLNLHDRLVELVEKYSNSVVDSMIGDKDVFIKQIKDSRNFYTHYSSELKKKALEGVQLYNLARKIKTLLISALLIESGFSREIVEELMKDKRHIYFTIHNF